MPHAEGPMACVVESEPDSSKVYLSEELVQCHPRGPHGMCVHGGI